MFMREQQNAKDKTLIKKNTREKIKTSKKWYNFWCAHVSPNQTNENHIVIVTLFFRSPHSSSGIQMPIC